MKQIFAWLTILTLTLAACSSPKVTTPTTISSEITHIPTPSNSLQLTLTKTPSPTETETVTPGPSPTLNIQASLTAVYAAATSVQATADIEFGTSTPTTTEQTNMFATALEQTSIAEYGTPRPTPTPRPSATPEPNMRVMPTSDICRQTVDRTIALKKDLKFPEPFESGESSIRSPADFDVNRYFEVLPNLKLQKGYRMDYVYFRDDLGGKPFIYTNPASQPRLLTYEDFLKSNNYRVQTPRTYQSFPHESDYLEHIQADQSPQGYFQFVYLALTGGQFYLSWHALYDDTIILCDSSDLKRIEDSVNKFEISLPYLVSTSMRKLDLTPTVSLGEKTVSIRVVQFTKWGGFREMVYTIQRQFPHKLLNIEGNVLINYDCGIAF
jgi:hypothetical protein